MKMILLLFAVLLASASEVQRLLKGENLTERELSREEIQDLTSQMKSKILSDHGIGQKKSPELEISIAKHQENEIDRLSELFKVSKNVFVVMIHFAGQDGIEKVSKTSKTFEKLCSYICKTLEEIPLAVRNVQNSAILQETDYDDAFRSAIETKQLSAATPFRLLNNEFLIDPNADPARICALQNKKTGSFCAFRALSLEALNLEAPSRKSWVFSDVLKFPRYSIREVPRIRKLMQCLVWHPNQKEPNQFYMSCASTPKFLGHVGGQAVLKCTIRHTNLERGTHYNYEYISESNKGVFSWSRSPSRHVFMNENVIAFCTGFKRGRGQYIKIFSVFDGGAKSYTDDHTYTEPQGTVPVIKSDKPGYASIHWDENNVTLITPESNWNFEDEGLVDYFNFN